MISLAATTFDKYDIKDIASVSNSVAVQVNSSRFDEYDLKDLQRAGVKLR